MTVSVTWIFTPSLVQRQYSDEFFAHFEVSWTQIGLLALKNIYKNVFRGLILNNLSGPRFCRGLFHTLRAQTPLKAYPVPHNSIQSRGSPFRLVAGGPKHCRSSPVERYLLLLHFYIIFLRDFFPNILLF